MRGVGPRRRVHIAELVREGELTRLAEGRGNPQSLGKL